MPSSYIFPSVPSSNAQIKRARQSWNLSQGFTNLLHCKIIVPLIPLQCTLQLIRYPSVSMPQRPEGEEASPGVVTTTGSHRRLPYTALTYIHLAFLLGCLGLLMPHIPAVGDAIACRSDGSVRMGEPQTE